MMLLFQARCLSQSDQIKTLTDQLMTAETKLQVIRSFFFFLSVCVLHGPCITFGYACLIWNAMVEPIAHYVG